MLDIKDIQVRFDTPDGTVQAVRGASMQVAAGETVAVVGESGSGKSQIMMAAMGLLAANGQAEGSVRFRDEEILGMPPRQLNRLRGKKITMIFQEPMTSLDPLYRIESQLMEPMIAHEGLSAKAARARALELMKLVQIPDPARKLRAYPHELSGGQRQRVMIAMALSGNPDLLIADEPTTALDVTIQAEILTLMKELQQRLGMSILFITHDLTIVEAFADRVYVMQRGKVVEEGTVQQVFDTPREDYTKMLLAAVPEGSKAPVGDAPVLLEGQSVGVEFMLRSGWFGAHVLRAVKDVSLALREGQTIGIVGESGSGKSTLGRALLRLQASTGTVAYAGNDISTLSRSEVRKYRSDLQMVFQDPYGSLSPRMTVGQIVAEGLRVHAPELSAKEREARTVEALRAVGLEPAMRNRFPHEFSGGQRQRIAVARAVILRPKVIVLDEPTSALDRSVQKQVIGVLRALQSEFGLSYIFISHDLSVVRALADYVMVMKDGAVVEEGQVQQIFDTPQADYTRRLIEAAFKPVRPAEGRLMPVLVGIGECMVEMSSAGEGLFRQGFAGDVFNTLYYARAGLGPQWHVRFHTGLGTDPVSQRMAAFFDEKGLELTGPRIVDRRPGLYMIELDGGERSFVYWRETSAARLLAEDKATLAKSLRGAEMVYFSGITLAILSPEHRQNLLSVLRGRHDHDVTIIFDPNIRPALWPDKAAMTEAISAGAAVSNVVLPSFDDERWAFGDTDPQATATRYRAAGADLVVVKNGGGDMLIDWKGTRESLAFPKVETPVDTTGAGDSFNGAFLANYAETLNPGDAVLAGHACAAQVIGHHGALV